MHIEYFIKNYWHFIFVCFQVIQLTLWYLCIYLPNCHRTTGLQRELPFCVNWMNDSDWTVVLTNHWHLNLWTLLVLSCWNLNIIENMIKSALSVTVGIYYWVITLELVISLVESFSQLRWFSWQFNIGTFVISIF